MKLMQMESVTGAELMLPLQWVKNCGMTPKRLVLQAGAWRREVRVELVEELRDVIGLSAELFQALKLPPALDYEVRLEGRTLHVGPVIALVVAMRTKRLTEAFLEKCKVYYARQRKVGGLVYVCADEGFDLLHRTVEGYFLQDDGTWQPGVFPYPGAVYNRTVISSATAESLVAAIGDRVFNSYYFDKWELYQWLHESSPLPQTILLDTVEELDRMLELHGTVYVKQADGSMGTGLHVVERMEAGYRVREKAGVEQVLADRVDMKRWIDDLVKSRRYLVQQPVQVALYEGRRYDFRVILQKGSSGHWRCTGSIARFGKQGSIATHFTAAGFARCGTEALQMVFGMSEKEAFLKEAEMIRLCVEACQQLDRNVGNYGDVGVDVMVDESRKVWILEINKLHDHRMPLYGLQDSQMYFDVVTTPLLYAKKLAGFSRGGK